MKIRVLYFGLIAQKTGCTEEEVSLELKGNVNFREYFEEKYPTLKNQVYKIAVNQNITDFADIEDGINEIAFLPPFAGG